MDALRRARSYSSNAHGEMLRSLRAPERPHSGNHRHAGCESDQKRGVSIDPVGYDAGKKIKGIKRTDKGGYQGLAPPLVIERTFSWLRRNRRLMAHYEALVMIAVGFAKLAMIGVMLKRLTEVAS